MKTIYSVTYAWSVDEYGDDFAPPEYDEIILFAKNSVEARSKAKKILISQSPDPMMTKNYFKDNKLWIDKANKKDYKPSKLINQEMMKSYYNLDLNNAIANERYIK